MEISDLKILVSELIIKMDNANTQNQKNISKLEELVKALIKENKKVMEENKKVMEENNRTLSEIKEILLNK